MFLLADSANSVLVQQPFIRKSYLLCKFRSGVTTRLLERATCGSTSFKERAGFWLHDNIGLMAILGLSKVD